MKKFLLILTVLLALAAPVFAQGAIEYGAEDNFVRVVESTKTDGGYDILGAKDNGEMIIFHADSATVTNVSLSQLREGQMLCITDSGMWTRSLPPQTYAVQIRDIDLANDLGLVDIPQEEVEHGVRQVIFEEFSNEDGIYRLFVRDTETDETLIYNCDHNTKFDVTPELLEEGDVLIIEDTGIMMLSLPAQLNAVSVTLPKVEGVTQRVTIEATETRDGNFWILAKTESGDYIQYLVTDSTMIDGNRNGLVKGMDLIITDNGMMTMSLPPQTNATYIKVLAEEITNNVEDLMLSFGYTFGYIAMDDFMNQGITVDGGYFARGILDTLDLKEELLISLDECYELIENYPANYEEAGIEATPGKMVTTAEEVEALPAPETLHEKFSYAWGFYATFQYMTQGLDLDRIAFPTGALTRLYGVPAELTMEEMDKVYQDYFAYKNMVYNQWIEEVTVRNLEDADSFIAQQKENPACRVLNEFTVIEPLMENQDPGAAPREHDYVAVNYTLQDLDGRMLDQGQNAAIPLDGVIPGFRDAILAMHVGDAARAYVHPEAGYGEAGAPPYVLPNSLLIFDIELLAIIDPAELN